MKNIEKLLEFLEEKKLCDDLLLKAKEEFKLLKQDLNTPLVWVRVNDRGDLFDPRLSLNPFLDEKTVIPLYKLSKNNEK